MTSHNCPAADCTVRVAQHQLMCRPHWYMVPKPLRDAVYEAYGHGRGTGSPAHRDAILAAVEAVNAKLHAAVPHIVTDPDGHRRHGCPTCLRAED